MHRTKQPAMPMYGVGNSSIFSCKS